MSAPRIIKKYPNRRLYDTAVSSYITLEDVKRLVMERVDFQVVDARTNEDITRSILLQIISEQEDKGTPIFTTQLLEQLIRFYGDALQGTMSTYLERSLQLFVQQQNTFREQLSNLLGGSPLATMTELAERNLALWRSMQDNFFAGGGARHCDGEQDPARAGEAREAKRDKDQAQ